MADVCIETGPRCWFVSLMRGYLNSQPLVLLWLERRLLRVMRNGCGFSGGGSSAKACAWDEYINSGLFTAPCVRGLVVGDLGGRFRV
jgi:hypothetical protein